MAHDSTSDRQGSSRNEQFSRRRYLKGVGAAAAATTAVPVASGRSRGATERHGIEFDRTVDMGEAIDEHGSWSDAIVAEAEDGTLLEFPPGEYDIDDHLFFGDDDDPILRFGLADSVGNPDVLGMRGTGERGDVRFVAPDNHRNVWFSIFGASEFLWENIDWEATGENQAGSLRFIPDDRLHVEDFELIGSTHAPDPLPEPDSGWSFTEQAVMMYAMVGDPDGNGVVKNVVAETGGGISADIDKRESGESVKGYARRGRRGAFYLGANHEGTIKFIDCHIEEFGSHGIYGAAAPGPIHVEGGVWRNNDNSQIRISGPDTYIEDARIEIDVSQIDDDSPTELEEGGYRDMKGAWWQYRGPAPGGEIRNTDIFYTEYPEVTSGYIDGEWQVTPDSSPSDAVHMRATGSGVTLRNTRISVKPDEATALRAPAPTAVDGENVAIELINTSITGPASEDQAVLIRGRPDSSIEDSCIHQTGANRDGVKIVDSDGTTVRNSRINVTGESVVEVDSDVTVENVKEVGSCPRPRGRRYPDENDEESN